MVSQVPQDEVQTPNAERQAAEEECRAKESTPKFGVGSSKFAFPADVAEPIAAAAREAGVEVYHAEMSGRTLRVQVECAAGATVDTCSDYSRALTSRLDAADFMRRQYTLEVSTPGIERRLYQPQDYTRAVNKHVKVLVRGGWVEGVLEAAGPTGITLRVDGKGQDAKGKMQDTESPDSRPAGREIAYAEIREAQIRVPDCELFARSTNPKPDSDATKTRNTRNGQTHSNSTEHHSTSCFRGSPVGNSGAERN